MPEPLHTDPLSPPHVVDARRTYAHTLSRRTRHLSRTQLLARIEGANQLLASALSTMAREEHR